MPGGVDSIVFSKQPRTAVDDLKSRHGLPDNYVLFLSNIEPRKNILRLVRAYSGLPAAVRQAHPLALVGGDSWLSEPIYKAIDEARAAGCTIVQPEKYVEDADLPALHSGAAALALPSIYEGFGLSPLQAMACGTPVLVSDSASLPEVAGEAALYVDPLNVDDIKDKLQRILTDKALRGVLSNLGLKQARTLSWTNSVDHLLRIISEAGTSA